MSTTKKLEMSYQILYKNTSFNCSSQSVKLIQFKTMVNELANGTDPKLVLGDRSYGKSGVRILHVVKNGKNLNH